MRGLPQCSCSEDSQRPGGQWGGQHEPKRAAGRRRKRCEKRNAPSLPPALPPSPHCSAAWPSQHKHSRLANQTQLPCCCHGLKTSALMSSTRPARIWGSLPFSSCPPAPVLPWLPLLPTSLYPQRVRSSPSYLFAFSKVSTFFQSSLFSVVYVSTLWE